MQNKINGFSLIELMLTLFIISIAIFGFLGLQKQSIRLMNAAQNKQNSYIVQSNCYELEQTTSTCDTK